MSNIGIVGAGAAAAAATLVVETAVPDADVTVLEKSGGVCGRAATRRGDGIVYDYGANYVKSDDDRVVELLTETLDDEGLVDATEPIYTFDAEGTVTPGRDADGHKWSYESGLTQIAKRLFGRTDATVHRRTRVETVRRTDDGWGLTDDDGRSWGPFDVLLLNPPAPQTAELLADAEWDDERREALRAAAAEVEYRTVWTAVLRYPSGWIGRTTGSSTRTRSTLSGGSPARSANAATSPTARRCSSCRRAGSGRRDTTTATPRKTSRNSPN